MIPLGYGVAIIGGSNAATRDPLIMLTYYTEIYHMKCSQYSCKVQILNQKIATPRRRSLAIPIPDTLARCISESKLR